MKSIVFITAFAVCFSHSFSQDCPPDSKVWNHNNATYTSYTLGVIGSVDIHIQILGIII